MINRSLLFKVMLVGLLALVLAACGSRGSSPTATPPPPPTEAPTTAPAPTTVPTAAPTTAPTAVPLIGDPLRGGLLYDKWWSTIGVDAPEEDQALWASQSTNTRSGSDAWRCKECHGWDYKGADGAYSSGSHFTGFVGVLDAAGEGPNFVLDALKGGTNADHDFSTVMDEQALIDLALFVAEETMDYDQFVGGDKMALGGDLAVGEELFQDNCSDCHGPEGTAINFKNAAGPEYIAGLSLGNPWEFSHKMRFGQPGEPDMASAIDNGWLIEEQLAVLAYAQSLPTSSPVSEGGLLYDKWWKATGVDAPEEDQPLWAGQSTNTRSGSDTWRCKECHGWDYKGADGAYSSGSHFTGFAGILDTSSTSTEDLVAWLDGTTDADHDFSPYLGEDQINMLAVFIQEGLVDMSEVINDDKTVNGDVANGETLFNAVCERCHGEDGTTINFGDDDDPTYLGNVANDNPWEFFHKSSFGQPDEHMPAGVNFDWSSQDLADVTSYSQTLPTE